jgi:uncharacterized protein
MTMHFVYKLIPPRPTFLTDMTAAEAAVMAEHAAYWTALRDQGTAVAFGPVADPAGAWGLAVVEAADEDEVERIRRADPAVRTGTATVEIHPMPGAVVRS